MNVADVAVTDDGANAHNARYETLRGGLAIPAAHESRRGPISGSCHLTDELERAALALLAEVDEKGGAAAAIEQGFFQDEIGRSAYEFQLRVERGETVLVGVNRFADGAEPPVIATPDYSSLERTQCERVAAVRKGRDGGAASSALGAITAAAVGYQANGSAQERTPLMPLIIDAVRARATVGEISDALAGVWGTHGGRG